MTDLLDNLSDTERVVAQFHAVVFPNTPTQSQAANALGPLTTRWFRRRTTQVAFKQATESLIARGVLLETRPGYRQCGYMALNELALSAHQAGRLQDMLERWRNVGRVGWGYYTSLDNRQMLARCHLISGQVELIEGDLNAEPMNWSFLALPGAEPLLATLPAEYLHRGVQPGRPSSIAEPGRGSG